MFKLYMYCSPYDGKWSKTMMGYGDEDTHFVMELTYNYGISSYRLGDGLNHITINTSENSRDVASPDGYKFNLIQATATSTGSINTSLK